jgi:Skp family chaperone for outer membrane proteins
MGVSPRKILAIGLSLAGVIYLAAPTQGQAPKADTRVQPAAANGNRSPGTFADPVPTVVGTIDLDYVFKNYDKVKAANKDLSAQIQIRKAELMKLEGEGRQVAEYMQKLQPGSKDYRDNENKITEIRAKMEAGKESAEREITLRQAETMATLFKEVQAYAQWVAKQRKITHVMTVSNTPPSGSDPNSVLAAVNRPVIYADPRNDITNDVVFYLNQTYNKMGKTDKPAARQQPAGGATTGRGAGDP